VTGFCGKRGKQASKRAAPDRRPGLSNKAMPLPNPEVIQFRSTMCFRPASRLIAASGAVVLLVGCMAEPRTYYKPQPITLHRHAADRGRTRLIPALSAPTLAQPLSADEKLLFQEFQASQSFKGPTVTAPQAAR